MAGPAAAKPAAEAATALSGWLDSIDELGWRGASADDAARRAGLDRNALVAEIGDRYGAIAAFLAVVGRASAQAAADADSGADGGTARVPVRDRLFDGLMAGFDALQQRRPLVLALAGTRDPALYLLVAARARFHVRHLAIVAGLPVDGLRGRARMAALMAGLARVFRAFRQDDSADMAETMAALDRMLAEGEELVREGPVRVILGRAGLRGLCPMAEDAPPDDDGA